MLKKSSHSTIAIISRQTGVSKQILLGIASYVKAHEKWALCLYDFEDKSLVENIRDNCIGAIIVDSGCLESTRKLEIYNTVPTIVVGGEDLDLPNNVLKTDDSAVAKIAANTFLDRGFQSLAFAGAMASADVRGRYRFFIDELEKHNLIPFVFSSHYHLGSIKSIRNGEEGPTRKRLLEWLASLPKPIGIFAADDSLAFEVYQAATKIGILIPEELALLGVNDDGFLCKITNPSLSSIRLPFEKMGYDAAKLLKKLIKRGEQYNNQPESLYLPIGLIARDSIKTVVVTDKIVRSAIIYIQENYINPINVEDILDELGVSRSLLERRFRDEIGITPLVELRRQRIEKARALLSDTNESINDMGKRCGFSSAIRFTTVFKEQVGMTPSEFRKQMYPVIRN